MVVKYKLFTSIESSTFLFFLFNFIFFTVLLIAIRFGLFGLLQKEPQKAKKAI